VTDDQLTQFLFLDCFREEKSAYILTSTHMALTIQLFGTKKSSETRAAERFFKERGVAIHVVDIAQKAMSPGELRNVASRVGGMEALIDREGKRYVDKGLKYAAPTGPRIEQMLIADPLLLRLPIVRSGNRATVGYVPDVWQSWIDEAKKS
jgi:arsenate reductase